MAISDQTVRGAIGNGLVHEPDAVPENNEAEEQAGRTADVSARAIASVMKNLNGAISSSSAGGGAVGMAHRLGGPVRDSVAAINAEMMSIGRSKKLNNMKNEASAKDTFGAAEDHYKKEVKLLIDALEAIPTLATLEGNADLKTRIDAVLEKIKAYKDSAADLNVDPIKSIASEWIDVTGSVIASFGGSLIALSKMMESGMDGVKPSAYFTSAVGALSAFVQIAKVWYRAGHQGAPTDVFINFKRQIKECEVVLLNLQRQVTPDDPISIIESTLHEGVEEESENAEGAPQEVVVEAAAEDAFSGASSLFPDHVKKERSPKEYAQTLRQKHSDFDMAMTSLLAKHEFSFILETHAIRREVDLLRENFREAVLQVIAVFQSRDPKPTDLKNANEEMKKHHGALQTFMKDIASLANKSRTSDRIELVNGIVALLTSTAIFGLGLTAFASSGAVDDNAVTPTPDTVTASAASPAAKSLSGVEFTTLAMGFANTMWALGVAVAKHVVKVNAAKSEGAGEVNRNFVSSKLLVENYLKDSKKNK